MKFKAALFAAIAVMALILSAGGTATNVPVRGSIDLAGVSGDTTLVFQREVQNLSMGLSTGSVKVVFDNLHDATYDSILVEAADGGHTWTGTNFRTVAFRVVSSTDAKVSWW